jgi:hypothetical protein
MKVAILLLSCLMISIISGVSAEITNSVNITTNLEFYLTAMKTAGPESLFKSDDLIYAGLLGTSTNYIYYRHFPSGNLDFHLFSTNGEEIPKTKAGLALSGKPHKPSEHDLFSSRQFVGYFVDNKGGEFRERFRPDEIFMITNKGTYDLVVQTSLCVIMSNGIPDQSAMIDARNVTGRGFPFAKDFGILPSPPLRVKVIKE